MHNKHNNHNTVMIKNDTETNSNIILSDQTPSRPCNNYFT